MSQLVQSSTMRRWAWSGALCGLLAALLLFAPATWLAGAIAAITEGRVLLTDPRGSVWAGSSGLVLAGGEGSAGEITLPSRIHWRISPEWMGLGIQLQAPCCTPQSPLALRLSLDSLDTASMALAAAPFEFPAQMLTGLGAPWNTLQLSGTLALTTQNLVMQWSKQQGLLGIAGSANLDAVGIETALSTVRPLGSYRVQLAGNTIRLSTLESADTEPAALVLEGTGEWSAQANGNGNGSSKASFRGVALAAIGREAALINLLHIIGQRQPSSDGRMRTTLSLG